MIVSITFKGAQGSGKTLLQKKIYSFLVKEGFKVINFEDIYGINVTDPVKTLKQKKEIN